MPDNHKIGNFIFAHLPLVATLRMLIGDTFDCPTADQADFWGVVKQHVGSYGQRNNAVLLLEALCEWYQDRVDRQSQSASVTVDWIRFLQHVLKSRISVQMLLQLLPQLSAATMSDLLSIVDAIVSGDAALFDLMLAVFQRFSKVEKIAASESPVQSMFRSVLAVVKCRLLSNIEVQVQSLQLFTDVVKNQTTCCGSLQRFFEDLLDAFSITVSVPSENDDQKQGPTVTVPNFVEDASLTNTIAEFDLRTAWRYLCIVIRAQGRALSPDTVLGLWKHLLEFPLPTDTRLAEVCPCLFVPMHAASLRRLLGVVPRSKSTARSPGPRECFEVCLPHLFGGLRDCTATDLEPIIDDVIKRLVPLVSQGGQLTQAEAPGGDSFDEQSLDRVWQLWMTLFQKLAVGDCHAFASGVGEQGGRAGEHCTGAPHDQNYPLHRVTVTQVLRAHIEIRNFVRDVGGVFPRAKQKPKTDDHDPFGLDLLFDGMSLGFGVCRKSSMQKMAETCVRRWGEKCPYEVSNFLEDSFNCALKLCGPQTSSDQVSANGVPVVSEPNSGAALAVSDVSICFGVFLEALPTFVGGILSLKEVVHRSLEDSVGTMQDLEKICAESEWVKRRCGGQVMVGNLDDHEPKPDPAPLINRSASCVNCLVSVVMDALERTSVRERSAGLQRLLSAVHDSLDVNDLLMFVWFLQNIGTKTKTNLHGLLTRIVAWNRLMEISCDLPVELCARGDGFHSDGDGSEILLQLYDTLQRWCAACDSDARPVSGPAMQPIFRFLAQALSTSERIYFGSADVCRIPALLDTLVQTLATCPDSDFVEGVLHALHPFLEETWEIFQNSYGGGKVDCLEAALRYLASDPLSPPVLAGKENLQWVRRLLLDKGVLRAIVDGLLPKKVCDALAYLEDDQLESFKLTARETHEKLNVRLGAFLVLSRACSDGYAFVTGQTGNGYPPQEAVDAMVDRLLTLLRAFDQGADRNQHNLFAAKDQASHVAFSTLRNHGINYLQRYSRPWAKMVALVTDSLKEKNSCSDAEDSSGEGCAHQVRRKQELYQWIAEEVFSVFGVLDPETALEASISSLQEKILGEVLSQEAVGEGALQVENVVETSVEVDNLEGPSADCVGELDDPGIEIEQSTPGRVVPSSSDDDIVNRAPTSDENPRTDDVDSEQDEGRDDASKRITSEPDCASTSAGDARSPGRSPSSNATMEQALRTTQSPLRASLSADNDAALLPSLELVVPDSSRLQLATQSELREVATAIFLRFGAGRESGLGETPDQVLEFLTKNLKSFGMGVDGKYDFLNVELTSDDCARVSLLVDCAQPSLQRAVDVVSSNNLDKLRKLPLADLRTHADFLRAQTRRQPNFLATKLWLFVLQEADGHAAFRADGPHPSLMLAALAMAVALATRVHPSSVFVPKYFCHRVDSDEFELEDVAKNAAQLSVWFLRVAALRYRERTHVEAACVAGTRILREALGRMLGRETPQRAVLKLRRMLEKFPCCVDSEATFCALATAVAAMPVEGDRGKCGDILNFETPYFDGVFDALQQLGFSAQNAADFLSWGPLFRTPPEGFDAGRAGLVLRLALRWDHVGGDHVGGPAQGRTLEELFAAVATVVEMLNEVSGWTEHAEWTKYFVIRTNFADKQARVTPERLLTELVTEILPDDIVWREMEAVLDCLRAVKGLSDVIEERNAMCMHEDLCGGLGARFSLLYFCLTRMQNVRTEMFSGVQHWTCALRRMTELVRTAESAKTLKYCLSLRSWVIVYRNVESDLDCINTVIDK